jgi:hypothetical protein
MMDDLTRYERRLVLAALWDFRMNTAMNLEATSDWAVDELSHEVAVADAIDSAVRKLGGDPSENVYGAPRY